MAARRLCVTFDGPLIRDVQNCDTSMCHRDMLYATIRCKAGFAENGLLEAQEICLRQQKQLLEDPHALRMLVADIPLGPIVR